MKNKRWSFTLLEMMVALAVLSMAAVAIGWQTIRLVAHHRFETGGRMLYTALLEAQMISMIHRTDSTFTITQEGGRFFYQWQSDEPAKVFHSPAQELKGVSWISIDKKGKLNKPIVFNVFSSGRIEPTLALELHDDAEKKIRIDLREPIKIRYEKG